MSPYEAVEQPSENLYSQEDRWLLPPSGFVMLNCDRAFSMAGLLAGCGGLLREGSGNVLFSYSHKHDPCNTLEAELWTIYHGISIVWWRGYRKIVVESNSWNMPSSS